MGWTVRPPVRLLDGIVTPGAVSATTGGDIHDNSTHENSTNVSSHRPGVRAV